MGVPTAPSVSAHPQSCSVSQEVSKSEVRPSFRRFRNSAHGGNSPLSLRLRALQGHLGQGPFSALRLGQGCPWAQSNLCKANIQAPRDIWKSQTASTHEKLKSDDGLKRPPRGSDLFCRTIISLPSTYSVWTRRSAVLCAWGKHRHSAVFSQLLSLHEKSQQLV